MARSDERFPRVRRLVLAGLVGSFLALGWYARTPIGIGNGDDLSYIALSQSLESGSYREIWRPRAPLQIKYPPAYPAWILALRRVFGPDLDVVLMANLVLVAGSIVLLYSTARRIGGPELALAAALLLCFNESMLVVGGSHLSEALYIFLTTAALVLAYRASSDRQTGLALAIGLSLLAFLTRGPGLAALLGVGTLVVVRRRPWAIAGYSLVSALVVGGWFLYATMAPDADTGRSYLNDLSLGGVTVAVGWGRHLERMWSTALQYGTAALPHTLSLPTLPGTTVDNYGWLLLTFAGLTSGAFLLWKSWRPALVYLVLYAGILMVWPWPMGRLLFPVVPLTMVMWLLGGAALVRRLPSPVRRPLTVVLMALLVGGALEGTWHRVQMYRDCDRASPYTSRGCYSPEVLGLAVAALSLRDSTREEGNALARKAASVHFLSGRLTEPAELLLNTSGDTALARLRLRDIRFVVISRLFSAETNGLVRTLSEVCHQLTVPFDLGDQALIVSTSPPTESRADACAALATFNKWKAPPPSESDDRRPDQS